MKQFIDSSGHCVVVALNQLAYAVVPIPGGNDTNTDPDAKEKVQLIKLNAPASSSSLNQINHNANPKQIVNEVQAVASKWKPDTKELICAVSRYDKFISVYSISTSGNEKGEMEKEIELNPMVVHKTNKRCCTLTFAQIPHAKKGEGEGDTSFMDIIVAGDLAGDANAFPVAKGKDDQPSQRRLLLGHTASMLTSVTVANGKLFSSDRDEKVRITSFPQTCITEGYLLGHDAYITDLTVMSNKNGKKLCITTSGDCTIRLWNYDTMDEIAKHLVETENDTAMETEHENEQSEPEKSVDGNEDEEQDEDDDDDGDEDDDGGNQQSAQNSKIPVRVSSNQNGGIAAVIYNGHCSVDLFSVEENKLELIQSIDCDSTPLAINFSQDENDDDILTVLLKESTYMKRYKKLDSKYTIMDNCPISSAIQTLGQKLDIQMPESVLEVDETTGKIKIMKKVQDESAGFVKHQPWLRGERVQIKKDKRRRRKKRRMEALHGGPPSTSNGNGVAETD